MRGYNTRANALLSNPLRIQEYRAFYPYGTTWLLAGTKFIFGTENFSAVAVIQSLLGSFSVLWTYFLSLRISKMPTIVAPAVGTLMVIYYPVLSLTGYTLSETPAIFLFTASALLTVPRTHAAYWNGLNVNRLDGCPNLFPNAFSYARVSMMRVVAFGWSVPTVNESW